ncbi:MAG: N-acetyl-gamma-glutamyl-phosphate reductase [Eubacteriales bacterium]|nr:N-acetyl-gamma-glutamyl-phosphate reductase [Eubacteriales bacterium]MDD4474753.1 N-acetyl-gamma-glutamyl-phosphate reductase [Eubacteriales bacterium]
MPKIYIDGSAGTTGLRINERLSSRDDILVLQIDESLRKDSEERAKLINSADITFLCLPDAAAKEAVSFAGEAARIIDASTAHRTEPGWSYGFPELSDSHRKSIEASNRVAVPGCHASGVVAAVYPLVKSGIIPADYPLCCFSLTGYSGGGKAMIADYTAKDRSTALDSPRQYALSQSHKHLPEITAVCGLSSPPMFSPIVGDFYSGMEVTVQLHTNLLIKKLGVKGLINFYSDYYASSRLISVKSAEEAAENGFIAANSMSGSDGMVIIVGGNGDRLTVTALFDNLGKGASGAAIQCMNIMLGCDETLGLEL